MRNRKFHSFQNAFGRLYAGSIVGLIIECNHLKIVFLPGIIVEELKIWNAYNLTH